MTVTATRSFSQRLRANQYRCSRCGLVSGCHNGRDKPTHCRACSLAATTQAGPETTWAARALCAQVDTELFFPGRGEANREAKAVCARCAVRAPCAAFAVATGQAGVWGGLSARERRELAGKAAS